MLFSPSIYASASDYSPKVPDVWLRCGCKAEYFSSKSNRTRLTVHSEGKYLKHPPEDWLEQLSPDTFAPLPTFLQPIKKPKSSYQFDGFSEPILEGSRWTTIDSFSRQWPHLDMDTLLFICLHFCKPPFIDQPQINAWERRIIEGSGQEDEVGEGALPHRSSLESQVSKELISAFSGQGFYYNQEKRTWYVQEGKLWREQTNNDKILAFIKEFVESHPVWSEMRETTRVPFFESVLRFLQLERFQEKEPIYNMVFSNGVLDFHGPDFSDPYLRQEGDNEKLLVVSPYRYDPEAKLSFRLALFLCQLTNGSQAKINAIRSWLRSLIVLDKSEQYALYLVGVGTAGKSVFSKLCREMISGAESNPNIKHPAVAEEEVSRISNRFELTKLSEARLVVFGDLPGTRLTDAQSTILKKIIAHDPMATERKHGDSYDSNVNFKTLFHANHPFEATRSSGFDRRFLFIECTRAVIKQERKILKILSESIPGLVQWALYTPQEIRHLTFAVIAFNDVYYKRIQNMVRRWVLEELRQQYNSSVALGASDKNQVKGTLWESYSRYANRMSEDPGASRTFCNDLMDTLYSLNIRVDRKRTAQGWHVLGVSLDPNVGQAIRSTAATPTIESLQTLDPFVGWIQDRDECGFDQVYEFMVDEDRKDLEHARTAESQNEPSRSRPQGQKTAYGQSEEGDSKESESKEDAYGQSEESESKESESKESESKEGESKEGESKEGESKESKSKEKLQTKDLLRSIRSQIGEITAFPYDDLLKSHDEILKRHDEILKDVGGSDETES